MAGFTLCMAGFVSCQGYIAVRHWLHMSSVLHYDEWLTKSRDNLSRWGKYAVDEEAILEVGRRISIPAVDANRIMRLPGMEAVFFFRPDRLGMRTWTWFRVFASLIGWSNTPGM